MKSIIFLIALAGCALAYTPGNEYTYTYKARLGMGIPELKRKASGMGIVSTVTFQFLEENKAVIQMSQIKVGEYLGDVKCEIHAPLPIRYSPISGHAQVLGEPFEVHLLNTEDDVMRVPKADLEWVTNIRKAVALMLISDSFVPTEKSDKAKSSFRNNSDTAIQFVVPTIHGSCETDTTYIVIEKSSERREVEKRMKTLKKNVEDRRETDNGLYNFVRSIDFDHCDVRVELFRSGLANISLVSHGQFDDVTSRSSVMNFTMLGQPGRGAVLTGRQIGIVSVNPMGPRTEKLMSISNQTIELESIKKISKPINLDQPTKIINHWYMEFASPFAPPRSPRVPYINYYSMNDPAYMPLLPENIMTGIMLSDEQIQENANILDKIVDDVADRLSKVGPVPTEPINPWNTNEAEIMTSMNEAAQVIKGVDINRLQKLFDSYQEDTSAKGKLKLILFVEIAATSGSGAPMKMLLNNMENGKITKFRTASIFTTLPNHFTYTPVIPDLVRYAKTLDLKKSPFLTSLVYVNLATILNRVCINNEAARHNSHFDLFGNDQCDSDQVARDMVTFLSDKFDETDSSWEKMVILQTMGNLGTRHSLNKLRNIITMGSLSITVKRAAIYALLAGKMERTSRDDVFSILMELVDDGDYDPYLRQISMSTLMTWSPSASWWQRLAVRSWNETSNNFGAYFYQIVKDFSVTKQAQLKKEAQIAQFILPMVKPYARSPWYTYSHFYGFRDEHEYVGSDYLHSVLRDSRTSYPLETFHHIWYSLGGIKFLLLETATTTDLPRHHFDESADSDYDDASELIRSLSSGKRSKNIDELMNEVESTLSRHGLPSNLNLFFKMFNNVELTVPLNNESIRNAFGRDGINILKKWVKGAEVHLTKFLDPTSMEIILPMDCGVPLIGRVNSPIVQGAEGHTKLRVKGKREPTISDLINAKDISVDLTSNYKFANKVITTFSGLIPWLQKTVGAGVEAFKGVNFPGESTIGFHSNEGHRNITYQFTPNQDQSEYPSHYFHTVPFLVIKSMWPGQDHKTYDSFTVLSINDDGKPVTERHIPISLEHFGIKGYIRYEGDHEFPYTMGNFIEYFHKNPALISQLFTTPSVRMSSSYIAVDFSKSEMKNFHTSISYTNPQSDERQRLWLVNALFEGQNSRYYEVGGTNYELSDKKSEFSFEISRNAIPKYNLDSGCYVYNMSVTAPDIDDYKSLLHYLEREEMTVHYDGTLNGGKTCNEKHLAKVTGDMTVSDRRKKLLAKELEESCDYDPRNPMVGFTVDPVYDKLSIAMTYSDIPNYVRNMSYHMYDWARGAAYPHVYFNYLGVHNTDKRITFTGERYVDNDAWVLRVELPKENIRFDHLRFPKSFDHIIPWLGIHPHPPHAHLVSNKILLSSDINKKCVLTENQVTTFDGKRYKYSPEPCPTVSVMNKDHPEEILLRTDLSVDGKMEAQIGQAKTGMTVTFSSKLFSINGDHIKLDSSKYVIKTFRDHYFAEARKIDGYVEVLVPGNFSVKLRDDKIEVTPAHNMRGQYSGMCGNFNGEIKDELVGPKRCLYSDADLFTKAWTEYQNVGCDFHHFESEKEEVKQFQKDCRKVRPYKNSKAMPLTNVFNKESESSDYNEDDRPIEECTEYVYIIKSRFGNICVSQESIARCRKSCQLKQKRVTREVYDCWTEDTTPAVLRKNLARGYVKEKVNVVPTVLTSFSTINAYICE